MTILLLCIAILITMVLLSRTLQTIMGLVTLAAIVFITWAMVRPAPGATLCSAELPSHRTAYWSYRIIDGRRCWYEGDKWKPKDELRWPSPSKASVTARSEAIEQAPPLTPPAVTAREEVMLDDRRSAPGSDNATPASEKDQARYGDDDILERARDNMLAFSCCWPELEPAVMIPLPIPRPEIEKDQPPAWMYWVLVLMGSAVGAGYLVVRR